MKQFLITLFTGKPRKGTPVSYGKQHCSITVPYNFSYDIWQQAVKEFGYQNFINWLIKNYK